VQTPSRRIGCEAAAMLIALMRGETVEAPRLDLGFSLAVRNSS
jgi:LacI family gluconate utilization system Gnt-I transcriptional repressor